MDGHTVRCGINSSCQSAATSEIGKAFLATTSSHVRSARPTASTGLDLYFYFFFWGGVICGKFGP